MKKQLLSAALSLCLPLFTQAQDNEWLNPEVNEVNRYPMHTAYFAYENLDLAEEGIPQSSRNYLSINGQWKFNWVADADQRPTGFFRTDYNDRGWDDIPVPGIWELHGYGDPLYVNIPYAWNNQFKNNPPQVPVEGNHVGSYRREIVVPAEWRGKDIIAHFGSVTSNLYLWVNGKYVGYSEDSKLEAEFDLTRYLKPGERNLIAFQVFRWCDGTYLECQDFWRLSGVARDCYLYAREKRRIEDIRATPDLDAAYRDATLTVQVRLKGAGRVALKLKDHLGNEVSSAATRGEADGCRARGNHPRQGGLPQGGNKGRTAAGERPAHPDKRRQPSRDGPRRRLRRLTRTHGAGRPPDEAIQHQRRAHLPLPRRQLLV